MLAVRAEVRKHICTQSSQLKLAGSGVGREQRNDYRLIKTDVRHKQLKYGLNIYKNPGLSYKCYVWEGDWVIYNHCLRCSLCLWLCALRSPLAWLSPEPGGTQTSGSHKHHPPVQPCLAVSTAGVSSPSSAQEILSSITGLTPRRGLWRVSSVFHCCIP